MIASMPPVGRGQGREQAGAVGADAQRLDGGAGRGRDLDARDAPDLDVDDRDVEEVVTGAGDVEHVAGRAHREAARRRRMSLAANAIPVRVSMATTESSSVEAAVT